MGKFWNWLTGVPDLNSAVTGIRARPLAVAQELHPEVSAEKIAHAKYRMDAIRRSVEQHGERLSDRHYDEFRAEIREHAHTLVKAGLIDDDEAAALIKHGKGASL